MNGTRLTRIAVNLGLYPDPSGAVPKFTSHEEPRWFAPQKPGTAPHAGTVPLLLETSLS